MTEPPAALAAALADRYRLERELGRGGMATVYLAEDLKHKRKVALKVLKPELAAVLGAERFVQEITTTAALQHPHILPLFDSGTADSFLFYVMPFIDGETVRGKLDREGQFAVDEAVQIAKDVAEALDYAHQHGVIHRDIKPENILLANGRPMVADFGIALAVSAAAGGRMTETGLSLGTPHYMSPEQATAEKEITARSDVYSLGSVLYEMLTGEPPHIGNSAQAIIMKIVTEDAQPVTRLRKAVPPNVAAAVAKAVERLPADRFVSASEFAAALGNPGYGRDYAVGRGATAAGRGSRLLIPLAVVAALALVAAAWGWLRPAGDPPVIRYQLALPSGQEPSLNLSVPVAAPDGSFLVYLGPVEGRPGFQLWIKRRNSPVAVPIAGTVDAGSFAISPDGEWIVFDGAGQLRKAPVSGGAVTALVSAQATARLVAPAGVAWLEDGTIVYTEVVRGTFKLATIRADGSDQTSAFADDSMTTVFPAPVWGTRSLLYTRCLGVVNCDLWAWDRDAASVHPVMDNVRFAQYAPTGHLVFVQAGRLLVAPFDPRRLEVTGSPVVVADSIGTVSQGSPMTLSPAGTLVTTRGDAGGGNRPYEMVWVDRSGRQTPVDTAWHFLVTQQANNHGWELSPDDAQLVIGLSNESGDDIWVKQLPRGPLARLTVERTPDMRPRWTPDGRSVTFLSNRSGGQVLQRRADGTGSDSVLVEGVVDEARWSPDGSILLLRQGASGSVAGGRDILGRRAGPDTTRFPILVTLFDEMAPAVSPDGRWMAYQSDETGRIEVFLRPFPNVDGFKRQVSNGGGVAPLWSRDGGELFYLNGDRAMVAVRVTPSGGAVSLSEPAALFRVPDELLAVESTYYTPWDVARDGRFIMARLRPPTTASGSTLIIAENWLTELKERMKR